MGVSSGLGRQAVTVITADRSSNIHLVMSGGIRAVTGMREIDFVSSVALLRCGIVTKTFEGLKPIAGARSTVD